MKNKKKIQPQQRSRSFEDFLAKRISIYDPGFRDRGIKNIEDQISQCPSKEEIERFLKIDISLGPLAIAMTKRHLDECDSCKSSFKQITAK